MINPSCEELSNTSLNETTNELNELVEIIITDSKQNLLLTHGQTRSVIKVAIKRVDNHQVCFEIMSTADIPVAALPNEVVYFEDYLAADSAVSYPAERLSDWLSAQQASAKIYPFEQPS